MAIPSLTAHQPHTLPGEYGIFNFGDYSGPIQRVKWPSIEATLRANIDDSHPLAENSDHATGLYMQSRRPLLVASALILLLALMLVAWLLLRRVGGSQVVASASPVSDGVTATGSDVTGSGTAVSFATSSLAASLAPPLITRPTAIVDSSPSPVPSQTPAPTASPEPTPSVTPTPPWSTTATAIALSDSVDRGCPNPPPAKPEYLHYYLSGEKWREPDAAIESHFWMSKPLPGGGRLLITDWLPYGYDAGGRYLLHNGVDAAEPEGTPLLAVADGLVVVAGDDRTALYGWRCNWYGHLVVIELEERWQNQPVYALYGHVLNIRVQPGERVSRGQPVAEVGVGGAATLPHLHFEVRVGSNEFYSTRNPLLWIEPPNTRGLIAGRLVDPDGRPWQGVAINVVGRSEGTEGTTTWTYLSDPEPLVKSDEGLAENFVVGDLKPGQYELFTSLQGLEYRATVEVEAGRLSEIEMVTEGFRTPTPEAAATEPAQGEG